jgi:hypothetical protein
MDPSADIGKSRNKDAGSGAGGDRRLQVAELMVTVALAEYSALRAEGLQLQSRVSSLVTYSLAGTAAVVSAGALGQSGAPVSFPVVLLLGAGLLVLISATCIGCWNSIFEIGHYLVQQADEIREVLGGASEGHPALPEFLLTWESRSVRRPADLFTKKSAVTWGGSSLEVVIVIAVAVVMLASAGALSLPPNPTPSPIAVALMLLDVVLFVALVVWMQVCRKAWRDLAHALPGGRKRAESSKSVAVPPRSRQGG